MAASLLACTPTAREDSASSMTLTVSILPQKALVEAIGGDQVTVQVLVAPGQSPATFEPGPKQMAQIARSQGWLRIGMPFESAWGPRIAEAYPGVRITDLSQGIEKHVIAEECADDPAHEGLLDPHVWTDPRLAQQIARNTRTFLVNLDPAHANEYASRFEALETRLRALDAEIEKTLAPCRGSAFFVFHPSWGYFARRYGLRQIPIEWEGKEPGPRGLARLIDQGREEGVRAIFVQKQFRARSATAVAGELGVPLIEIDPLAEDYFENLRQVARHIAEATP